MYHLRLLLLDAMKFFSAYDQFSIFLCDQFNIRVVTTILRHDVSDYFGSALLSEFRIFQYRIYMV